MAIIGLRRRLVEVGRIRMGEKNEKGNPTRLETWKLTSRDELRLTAAAQVFGGDVVPWKDHPGQFALVTAIDQLPVLLMPGQAISQHYELWSGGGCKRRCDGENESISDKACLCDPENRECKPHTRLNVLLPDVAGIGCWRLDTQGYYAATELAGTVDLLEIATMRGVLLPARLRIDQRSVLRDGQTKRFPVPTLDIDVRPLEMHAITQAAHEGEVAVLPSGYRPVAELAAGTSLQEGLDGAEGQSQPAARTGRSAAPVGEVGDFLDVAPPPIPIDEPLAPAAVPPVEPEQDGAATSEQQKLLMATAREHGWGDADRYELTERICGVDSDGVAIRSVKKIPKGKVDEVLHALKQKERSGEDIPLGGDGDSAYPDSWTTAQLGAELVEWGGKCGMKQQVEAALIQHVDDRDWILRQIPRLKDRFAQMGTTA